MVFVSTSNHSLDDKGYQYLDNFKFYQTPICASPINVNVLNITSTTADVFWDLDNEGNIPSSYKITVVDNSGNYVYNNSSIAVDYLLTYSLSGLTPNTEYTVTLQGDCSSASSGLSNFSTEYKFTTLCESVSLPYSQNFDAVASVYPDCWVVEAPNSSSGINTSYKYGSYGKSMKMVSTVGAQVSMSTVQINHASNDMEVDFMVYATSVNTTVDVGLITDPSDFSTFELLYSADVDEASVWKNFRFNTSNSLKGIAANSSVCFRLSSGYAKTVYIDNVTIKQKPSCSRLENPVVNFVDSASVSLSWTEVQTPSTNNYIVECVNLNTNDTTYVTAQYNVMSVTGLSPETEYSLRVCNVCAPGDTSEWSNAVTCKTLCGALPLPLIENFNSSKSLPECWSSSLVQPATSTNGSSDPGWSIYTGTSSYSRIDGYSLMSPNAGDGARYLLSLPAINIPDNEEYELVFWMYRPNTNTNECINVYVNSVASLSGAVKLDSVFRGNTGYPVESEGAKFYECFYTIPLKGTVYIMLEASFPDAFSTFKSRNFYIDNLFVTPKPPCRNGINSITDEVDKDAETIKLTWQTKTDEREWIISAVFKNGESVAHICKDTVVSDLQYILDYSSFVEPGIDYNVEFHISGYCNRQDTSEASVHNVYFRSNCAPVNVEGKVQIFDSFEDYGDELELTTLKSCYKVSDNTNFYIKGQLGKTIYQTGTVCVPFSGNKQLAVKSNSNGDVKCKVHLIAGEKYHISIFTRLNNSFENGGTLKFFYHQVQDSNKVFITEDNIVSSNEWGRIVNTFSVAATGDYYVGFEYSAGNSPSYMVFDDFLFKKIECELPAQCELVSLKEHEASFSVPNYSGTWEIRLCDYAPGFYEEEPVALFADTVTGASCTISGLESNVNYYYVVRSVCGNVYGDWSEPELITTNCAIKDIPYIESFETSDVIRCWHEMRGRSGIVELSQSKSKTGAASLKVNNTEMVSPELNVSSLTDYYLSGWVYAEQDSVSNIGIGVMTNPLDIVYYDLVENVSVNSINGWTEFTVYFDVLNTPDYEDLVDSKYIVLSCLGNGTYYFDDVKILPKDNCMKPYNVIAEEENGNVKLTWESKGNETGWKVNSYKVVNDKSYLVSDTTVSVKSVILSGFEANSTCLFSVQTVCASSESSEPAYSNEYVVPCTSFNLPYSVSCGKKEIPCWDVVGNSSLNWAFSSYSGSMYYINTPNFQSSSDTACLVLPQFNTDGYDLLISVDGLNSATGANNIVELLYSVDGGNTYTAISGTCLNPGVRGVKQFVLPNTTSGKIQFKIVATSTSGGRLSVYGFSVENVLPCAKPQSLNITVVNDKTSVSVIDSAAEHNSWQYVIGQGDFDVDYQQPVSVGSEFEISDLKMSSVYKLYVRTDCNGAYSNWAGPYSFITPCGMTSLPYSQDFENITSKSYFAQNCVGIISENPGNPDGSITTSSKVPYADVVANNAFVSDLGSYSIKLASSADYNIYYYLPQVDISLKNVMLSFCYYEQSNTSLSRIVVGIMRENLPSSFVDLYQCPYTDKAIDDNVVKLDLGSLIPSGDYSGYVVAFKYSAGTRASFASLDNIVLSEKEKCAELPSLSLADAGSDYVRLNADFYADSLSVKWGVAGTAVDDCTNLMYVQDNDIAINDLSSGVAYDVYVRTVCATGNGYWVGPYTVSTICSPIAVDQTTPWTENFDVISDENYSLPSCMSRISQVSSGGLVYPRVIAGESGNKEFVLKDNGMVALPLFDKSANKYGISFYAKGSGDIVVGALDALNVLSFKKSVSVKPSEQYVKYDIDLANFDVDGKFIAITSSLGSDIKVDSLMVYYNPQCFAPRFLNVDYLDDNSVKLSFVMPYTTNHYEYMLVNGNDTVSGGGEESVSGKEFSSLRPNTEYHFAIRSVCSTDTSDWSQISFTTYPSSLKAPFLLNFENESMNSYLKYVSDIENYFIIGSDPDAVNEGDKALYITDNGADYHYTTGNNRVSYVTIPVVLSEGTYSISYDWKAQGSQTYDYGRVFLAPVDMTFTSAQIYDGLTNVAVPDGCYPLDGNKELSVSKGWQNNTVEWTVEESAAKNIVIAWITRYAGVQGPLAIDNVTLNKYDCSETVTAVNILSIGEDSVEFSVNNNPQLLDSIKYELSDSEGNVVVTVNTVNADGATHVVRNLTPDADYTLAVSGYCNEGISNWRLVGFHTLCDPIQVNAATPYFESFEGLSDNKFEKSFHCWDYSSVGNSALSVLPNISNDETQKAHSGLQAMTLVYNNKVDIAGKFELEAGNYEVSFYAVNSVAKAQVAVMSRVRGAANWDTLRVQNVNDVYEPVAVRLNVPANAVYDIDFMIDNSMSTTGYLTIDDISIKASSVVRPSLVNAYNVSYNSADVSWTSENAKNRVQLFDSLSMAVLDTVVANVNDLHFANLLESMNYRVDVRGIEGNDTSVVESSTFQTLCAPVESYSENFDSYAELDRPQCWSFTGYKGNGEKYVMPDNYPQWEVKQVADQYGLMVQNSAAASKSQHTVYSPLILAGSKSVLSFDYYNNATTFADSLVVTIESEGVESTPILVASAKSSNSAWTQFSYDLSEYDGRVIRVKFFICSSQSMQDTYVGIDNISVSCHVNGDVINDVVCEGTNYSDHGFNIPASQYVVGDTIVRTRLVAGGAGACDTLYTLKLFVPQTQYSTIYDTICEGDVYNNGQFVNLTKENRYLETYSSSLGCDSIVTLFLTVIERETHFETTICEGDSYTFGGEVLTVAGVYRDSLMSSKGCDSVSVLTLKVYPKYYRTTVNVCENSQYNWCDTVLTTTGTYSKIYKNKFGCDSVNVINFFVIPTNSYIDVEICQGQEYEFGDQKLTQAGEFSRTITNSEGCDSIINLTLTVSPSKENNINDYVCEGDSYSGYGLFAESITKDTVLTKVVRTIEGCDSFVNIILDVVPTVYYDTVVTIQSGDVYEFAGNSYSQAGTYVGNFYTDLGCDSIVTLTLVVTTDVDNSYALPLVVAPNPVLGGQSTFVNREWTAEEQNGMRVEVLNSVGQVVEIFTPTTFPIEVSGIYTSGVYYIRVTSGTGDIYLGRLVVK